MSEGTEFLHVKTGKELFALRTRACAKVLPCQRIWEKVKNCKELSEDIVSLIKWPTEGSWKD